MSDTQPEAATYDATVYQLQTTDLCQGATPGGAQGVLNQPLLSLANRTGWLKAQVTTGPVVLTSNSGSTPYGESVTQGVAYQKFPNGRVEFYYVNLVTSGSSVLVGGIATIFVQITLPFALALEVLAVSFMPTDIGGSPSALAGGLTITLVTATPNLVVLAMQGSPVTNYNSAAISGTIVGI
jgi:hypothetical protein